MKPAKKKDWKTTELPSKRESLDLQRTFTINEMDQISQGLIPKSMDDKWFIYSEANGIYFHRSWSGSCIYFIKIEKSMSEFEIVESWVNREPTQYSQSDIDYDLKLLSFLIDAHLLNKSVHFPIKEEDKNKYPNGAYQHSFHGRQHGEKEV